MDFEPLKRGATTGTDLVYSSDDGRYYLEQFATLPGKTRVSVRVFKTAEDAKRAFERGDVRWMPWT